MPAQTADYVTKSECDSKHVSSKVSISVLITVFVGIVGLTVASATMATQADARSQRNEARIDAVERSIDAGFLRLERAIETAQDHGP